MVGFPYLTNGCQYGMGHATDIETSAFVFGCEADRSAILRGRQKETMRACCEGCVCGHRQVLTNLLNNVPRLLSGR